MMLQRLMLPVAAAAAPAAEPSRPAPLAAQATSSSVNAPRVLASAAPVHAPAPVMKPGGPVVDFDPEVLRKLFGDDPTQVRMIAKKFVNHTRSAALQMREACTVHDAEALRKLGHKYKSSAAMIGAHRIAEICRELERAGTAGQIEACGDLVNELPGLLDQISRMLMLDAPA
jgi:HPt (histidine-containing phosphotransfer) domain-containing protein